MANIKSFRILEINSQNCHMNLFFDFSFFYLRAGLPILVGDDGAFNKILILGVNNCYNLMEKKLVQNTMKHISIFS